MIPDLMSKIKTEIQEEIIEKSRISELEPEPIKEQPKVIHKHYTCD